MKNLFVAAALLASLFAAAQPGRLTVTNADKGGKVSIDTNLSAKLNSSDTIARWKPLQGNIRVVEASTFPGYTAFSDGLHNFTDTIRLNDEIIIVKGNNTLAGDNPGNRYRDTVQLYLSDAAKNSNKQYTVVAPLGAYVYVRRLNIELSGPESPARIMVPTGGSMTFRCTGPNTGVWPFGRAVVENRTAGKFNSYDAEGANPIFAPGLPPTGIINDTTYSLRANGGWYKNYPSGNITITGSSLYNNDDTLRNLVLNTRTLNGARADLNFGSGTSNLDNLNRMNVYTNRGYSFEDSLGGSFRSTLGRVVLQSPTVVRLAAGDSLKLTAPTTFINGTLTTRKDNNSYGRITSGINTDTLQGVMAYQYAHLPPDDVEVSPDSSHYYNAVGVRGDYNAAVMEGTDLVSGSSSIVTTSYGAVTLNSNRPIAGRTHTGSFNVFAGGVDIRGRSLFPGITYESQVLLDTAKVTITSRGGARYTDNFAADFGPRSLPDVAWVQQQIAASGGGGATPGGADGDVQYKSGSSLAGSNLLHVDAPNGRVGVGTSSPSEKVEIAGNVKLNNGGALLFNRPGGYDPNGNGGIVIGQDIANGAANAMYIFGQDNGGRIFLGSSSRNVSLDLRFVGGISAMPQFTLPTGFSVGDYNSPFSVGRAGINNWYAVGQGGSHLFFGDAGNASPASGSTIVAAINAAGRLTLTTPGEGIELKSPNGTRYLITVSNSGTLTTTPL